MAVAEPGWGSGAARGRVPGSRRAAPHHATPHDGDATTLFASFSFLLSLHTSIHFSNSLALSIARPTRFHHLALSASELPIYSPLFLSSFLVVRTIRLLHPSSHNSLSLSLSICRSLTKRLSHTCLSRSYVLFLPYLLLRDHFKSHKISYRKKKKRPNRARSFSFLLVISLAVLSTIFCGKLRPTYFFFLDLFLYLMSLNL